MTKLALDDKLIKRIEELSPKERQLIEKQLGTVDRTEILKHRHHYPKNHAKFGYFCDPHVGEKQFKENLWVKMCHTFMKEGITNVYGGGDNLEGMSGRDGQIYDLTHIGFSAQAGYLEQLVKAYPSLNFYCIDGNHDGWYAIRNNSGIIVGEELEKRCNNWHFLGSMEADVELAPNVTLKLFHANDGSAYALSYKLQKLIESFTGGEKPSIVIDAHYHKHLTAWIRNVFGIEGGCLCDQTRYMRGKKLAASMGFGIMDVWYDKKGIERVDHTWFPYYSRGTE